MNKENISVVIPIKSDVDNLREIIRNLTEFKFTDIHVVDSEFVYESSLLCEKENAQYTVFKWNGRYPKKRNWYLDYKSEELRNWVLFLDSDERLTQSFDLELKALSEEGFDALKICYTNTFLGRSLRYGDTMTKIPFFRKQVRFEKIEEQGWSNLDMEVHEHPILPRGRIKKMRSRIDHLENSSIEHYLKKHNNYSNWESNRLRSIESIDKSKLRIRIKYGLLRSRFAGYIYFIYVFFLRLGFLDGFAGYAFAKLKSQYFFWVFLKYIDNRASHDSSDA